MDRLGVVRVETGARLHLGFYGLCSNSERVLGGIGIAVDGAGYVLEARRSSNDSVKGCDSERAYWILEKAKKRLGVEKPIEIRIEKCIPSHVGLGSTTQLTLALYTALAKLMGMDATRAVNAARRGPYSGIGVGVFLYGGFILDAGVRASAKDNTAKPALRGEMPEEWRIVAIIPKTSWRVQEGHHEEELMLIPRGSMDMCCRAMYALLRMVVPGIAERDFQLFASGVEEIQRLTGSYFSGAQSGLFCCTESQEAAEKLRKVGAKGIGQSSWGPLVYGFFPSGSSAVRAFSMLRDSYKDRGLVLLLKPRNSGARIMESFGSL